MRAHNYRASYRSKRNQAVGEFSQDMVRHHLERMGFKMVERVHTPFTVIRRLGRVVGAFPKEKVSGDFIAIQPLTGRKLLCEVKSRESGVFPWSMMEDHQRRALDENHICGGISMLALWCGGKIDVRIWPVLDFGPGKSLKMTRAKA